MPDSPWSLVRTLGRATQPTPDHPWEPLYGNVPGPRLTEPHRIELAAVVEDARRKVCAYGRFSHGASCASDYKSADETRCDCKYGRFKFYTQNEPKERTSEMTGCPELRELVYHLLHGDIDRADHRIEDLTNQRDAHIRVADARLEDLNHQNELNRELGRKARELEDALAAEESESATLAEERDSAKSAAENNKRQVDIMAEELANARREVKRMAEVLGTQQSLALRLREELDQVNADHVRALRDIAEQRDELEELATMLRDSERARVKAEADAQLAQALPRKVMDDGEYLAFARKLAHYDLPDPFYVAQEMGLVPEDAYATVTTHQVPQSLVDELAGEMDLEAGYRDAIRRAGMATHPLNQVTESDRMTDDEETLPGPKRTPTLPRRPRSA
jgi:hypothetical protein